MASSELLKTVLKDNANLKAYYRFESGSTDEMGVNNGTDTAINYVSGKYGNCAEFNGSSSKIVLPKHANTLPTGDFSFTFWIKTSSINRYIYDAGETSGNFSGTRILIQGSGYIYAFFAANTGTGFPGNYFDVINGAKAVNDNLWHHICVVHKNGATISVYVDSIVATRTYTAGVAYDASLTPVLGFEGSSYFAGLLDDFAILSTALSADQVKELYEGRFIGESYPQAGLVAGYHLNGSSTDFSGNNYHLTDTAVTYAQANGKFGQGGSYNGSSSKSLLNSALGITGNISLSLWIQQNAEIGSGAQTYIFTYNKTNGRQYSIGYEYNSGTRRLFFSADKVDVVVVNTTFNITLGTTNWYHAVLTYDGSTLKAYLNGNLVNSTASTGNGSLSYNACFRIGCTTNVGTLGDSLFANAKIDEALVFNRALTAQEIRRMYAVGTGKLQ